MYKKNNLYCFLLGVLATFLLGGCSADDVAGLPDEDIVPVRFEINRDGTYTRAPGDAALSVNRILILPFKKTDEIGANDPTNFQPDFSAAKQIDVNSFPAVATMLNLSAASTYQIMVIGYNRNDYDFANQGSSSRRFSMGSMATPTTLANMYLQPMDVTAVPEFFSCMGVGYQQSTLVGNYFKPGDINNVRGTLKRIVSGFTLTVHNVPSFVSSMTLVAEQLVTATKALDGSPLLWQSQGDGGVRVLGTQTPILGKVTISRYMLSAPDAQKSLFYLDVSLYGLPVERYTVKVPDTPNVSSGNRIIFLPNHWVQLSGDYNTLNIGFTLTDNVNLDDPAWDGLQ